MKRTKALPWLLFLSLSCEGLAWSAMQTRPPGLNLVGPHLGEMEHMVKEARQAIEANRLTKPGAKGSAARDLLERILTADPYHRDALALMEQLIGTVIDRGRVRLEQEPPDLEGAREYWVKARDLALRYRVEVSAGRLDALMSEIEAKAREAVQAPLAAENARLQRESSALRRDLDRLQAGQRAPVSPARSSAPAVAPRSTSSAPVSLRSSTRSLSEEEVKSMFAQHDFYHRLWNPDGSGIGNRFVDNGDGTITDSATSLMWQRGGSSGDMPFEKVDAYINGLNRYRFGGHKGWRLPTLEEAASLLESKEANGRYIASLFDKQQWWIWTADEAKDRRTTAVWRVGFVRGDVRWLGTEDDGFVRACRAVLQ